MKKLKEICHECDYHFTRNHFAEGGLSKIYVELCGISSKEWWSSEDWAEKEKFIDTPPPLECKYYLEHITMTQEDVKQ